MFDAASLVGRETLVMGVINVTPDSFSGDGIYRNELAAAARAAQFEEDGASLLDVGGESTRPGFSPVDQREELARVIPAVRAIIRATKLPISIDTRRPAVAERAIAEGATVINDVSGLSDFRMAEIAAREDAGLVCMYNGQIPVDVDTGDFLIRALNHIVERARRAGVSLTRIVVDPGLGFGKRWKENFAVLRSLNTLTSLELPILVGTSRKKMVARVVRHNQGVMEGSLALAAMCAAEGATIVRVHDVAETVKTVRMIDALRRPEQFRRDSTRR